MSSMHKNRFEQESQQQMENFRLQPAGVVWENVEKELKKKKRRRVLFFIILPLLVSIGGYGVYQLNTKQNRPVTKQDYIKPENELVVADPENQKIEKSNEKGNEQEKEIVPKSVTALSTDQPVDDTPSSAITKKDNTVTIPISNKKKRGADRNEDMPPKLLAAKVVKQKSTVDKTEQEGSSVSSRSGSVVKEDGIEKRQAQRIITEQDNNKETENTANKKIAAKSTEDKSRPDDKQDTAAAFQDDKIANLKRIDAAQINDTAKSITANVPAIDSVLQKASVSKKIDKRIKWGVNFSGGISGSRTNVFAISSTEKSENLYDNFPTPGNSTGNGGTTPVIVTLPSAIKTGAAFNIGLVAEKRLTKRSSVSSGVQYTYLSERMTVGIRKDSIFQLGYANYYSQSQVGMAYRGVSKVPYTNKYHFIKIPLLYHLQLNKSEKTPLRWDVGVSAAYLFANNGLVYDTVWNGLYYKQKNAFSKLHMSLQTGISIGFGKPGSMQWQVGPELSMDMTKLIAQPYDAKRYLFYSGIKAQLFFKKKK